jgi:putative ABC transport system permease protein
MFRNYLSAALNNLIRNKLYAAINIVGLAVGFAAAILIGLYVRDEFGYNRWIPGADEIYNVYSIGTLPGRSPLITDTTDTDFADFLKLEIPQIVETTRIMPISHSLRHGRVEANQMVYWADANVFSFLNMPVIAGDLKTALQRPDGIVITRKMARKYFGSDTPIGKTIEIDRAHPMQVTAVLEDFPSNTSLAAEIFASGKADFSYLAYKDAHRPPSTDGSYSANTHVFLRLQAGARPDDVKSGLASIFRHHRKFNPPDLIKLEIVPLSAMHLHPATMTRMAPPNDSSTVYAVAAIGILILLIAVINFVNLMTARASRRAVEVGVRKAAGASRSALIVQFVGEAMLYVALSMVLAFALAELLLPALNAFLGRSIVFDYWREPRMLAGIAFLMATVGLAAGAYPAFVLSAFRPAAVLKAGKAQSGRTGGVRGILVILQFAILIGMIIAAGVVYSQTQYALKGAIRLDKDQVLLIEGPCRTALEQNIRNLSGVRGVACSSPTALGLMNNQSPAILPDGRQVFLFRGSVDFGFFEFYDIKPIAGRLFSRKHSVDAVSSDPNAPWHPSLIINESAVPMLGFANPQAAIGKMFRQLGENDKAEPSEIIGVVPDFSLKSVREQIGPTVYYVSPANTGYLNVRLSGNQIPETLTAIDRAWRQSGQPKSITRFFLDEHMQSLYLDMIRQGQVFAIFAGLAVLIACLGMFGLSAFTAEQRTKEIGIRKAMGADTRNILHLLLWQFAKPVLWANLIAWPLAGWLMWNWLNGFAYRIALPLWLLPAASALALGIALLTVLLHSWLVARAKPVTALRYE